MATEMGTQIRRSCDLCSSMKIGCTKEKPTCARCARRGETCIYAATRRAGRRPSVKQKSVDGDSSNVSRSPKTVRGGSAQEARQIQPQPKTGSSTTTSLLSSPDPTNPTLDLFSGENFPPDYVDFFTSMPMSDGKLSDPTPLALPKNIDDFLASISPLSTLNSSSRNGFSSSSLYSGARMTFEPTSDVFVAGNHAMNDSTDVNILQMDKGNGEDFTKSMLFLPFSLPTTTSPSTPSNRFPSTSAVTAESVVSLNNAADASQCRSAPAPDFSIPRPRSNSMSSVCECFENSLSLLSKLTPPSLPATHPNQSGRTTPGSPPSFESIMAQNHLALDTVSKMLKCTGTHDDSILCILTMIVLKTLGWYAAAASAIPNGERDTDANMDNGSRSPCSFVVQPPSESMVGYDFEGEKPERVACQLVLSKIHLVQRIVNQLSTHLQTAEAKTRETRVPNTANRTANVAQDLLFNGAMFDPLTCGSMVRDLESNLRGRLRELYQSVIDTLLEN